MRGAAWDAPFAAFAAVVEWERGRWLALWAGGGEPFSPFGGVFPAVVLLVGQKKAGGK